MSSITADPSTGTGPGPGTTTAPDIDEVFQQIVQNEQRPEDQNDDSDDTGDHERFSHYVSKEDIVLSSTTGRAVFALCGKKWTPKRNPEKYPVCPDCKKVFDQMQD